jgi:hypothetical protein
VIVILSSRGRANSVMNALFHPAFRGLMVLLGFFEFYSAYTWITDAAAQQREAHEILPASILGADAHFLAPWVSFLIALGCVRLTYGMAPESKTTWWTTFLTHVAEEFFWIYYATVSHPSVSVPQLVVNAAQFTPNFHCGLVLVGPLLLLVFLIADYPAVVALANPEEKVKPY